MQQGFLIYSATKNCNTCNRKCEANKKECEKFLELLKISGGEDSPPVQSNLPNTEDIHQPEEVDMLDDVQYILLLNTISQTAGSIPDDVGLREGSWT